MKQQISFFENNNTNSIKDVLNTPLSDIPTLVKNAPSIQNSLDSIFPEQKYNEKTLQKAKQVLGEITDEFSDVQLQEAVTEVQFLADCWLDEFEKKTYGGLTLQELLHEKGKV